MENNFFGIRHPMTMDCTVKDYRWSGSSLVIQLNRQNSPEVQYLRFRGVEYYAGPFKWTGANFKIRPASDCLQLLREANRISDLVEEHHLEERGMQLYIVELPESEVHIIANYAARLIG